MRTSTRIKPTRCHQLLICALLLALAPVFSYGADKAQKLFNGKDLAGWRAPTGTWSVA